MHFILIYYFLFINFYLNLAKLISILNIFNILFLCKNLFSYILKSYVRYVKHKNVEWLS